MAKRPYQCRTSRDLKGLTNVSGLLVTQRRRILAIVVEFNLSGLHRTGFEEV